MTDFPSVDDDELITQWGFLVEGYSRAMRVLLDAVDRSDSLPQTWFEVLIRLERSPGFLLPMTQLAHEVDLTSGGFTKVADRMTEAGLLERRNCPTDRRVTWVALTEAGLGTARSAKSNHATALRSMVERHLSAEELRDMGSTMRKLRDGLELDLPPASPSTRS